MFETKITIRRPSREALEKDSSLNIIKSRRRIGVLLKLEEILSDSRLRTEKKKAHRWQDGYITSRNQDF